MKRMRVAWALMAIMALLLAGCARGLSRQQGMDPVDPIQEAIAEAELAVEAVMAAAQEGDLAAVRAAYQQFSQPFGQLLGPVSLEDPNLAQQMANANSAIKEMLTRGQVDPAALEREAATIRQGLAESTAVMVRAKEKPGSVQREVAPVAAAPAETADQGEAHLQGHSGQEQRFTVVATDYRFQPTQIRVKKGSKVTIRFENKGTQRHEFELPDFDFEIEPVEPGQAQTGSFIASKASVIPFECDLDDHLQKGMKGILIVEE